MRTYKQSLGVIFIILFLLAPLSAKADSDIYSPDNSVKADAMQSARLTGGNMQVGEFTGAAVYNYPISVPAGRNGMTPSVQLTYNSQDSSAENIVGYQWDLNLYSIKRLNKKGVERLYSETDFTANTPAGGGELLPIQLTDWQYGQYGQKAESGFAKYEYKDDGSWVVTDKSGVKYTFGKNEDAIQSDPDDSSRAYQWMLSEIRDTNDNFIRYTYYKADGQIYPRTIHYTGHGADDGIFEVRFLPFADGNTGAAREDRSFGYSRGFRVDTDYLVSGIEIISDGLLRRKYEISYTSVDPFVRQTISSIEETGYDENGNAVTLPPTEFEYTGSDVKWEESANYMPTWTFENCYYLCEGAKNVYEWDMTGDGLTDFEFYDTENGPGLKRVRAVNNGKGGWEYMEAEFIGDSRTAEQGIPRVGVKALDFDGDLRADIIQSREYLDAGVTYLNSLIKSARGEINSDTIMIGMEWGEVNKTDNGVSIADLNGDGLPDMIQARSLYYTNGDYDDVIKKKTCLNSEGTACNETDLWEAPELIIQDDQWQQFGRQSYVQDCNADGLADFYSSGKKMINDGKGNFVDGEKDQCRFSVMDSNIQRSADVNGDGLMDYILSYMENTWWGYTTTNKVTLNTGDSGEDYDNIFPIVFGTMYTNWHFDSGVRIVDLNGDLLPDVIQSLKETDQDTNEITTTKKVYMNKGSRPYFLKTVRTAEGGKMELEYKTSAQYIKADGAQANPDLPMIVTTVSKMTVDDGMWNESAIEYFYEDGHYHYNSVYDRALAGFRVVTKTDSLGFVTKNYYHQGENSVDDTENGEYKDHISKNGIAYRSEVFDDNGNLVKAIVNKYDKKDLGYGGYYPFLDRTVSVDYDADDGTNRATARAFEFDVYGNPTQIIDYGEVELKSSDGQFTDIGTDLIKQRNTYVQNADEHIVGLPAEQKTFDQNDELIAHQRVYYDGLSLGDVAIGNPTAIDNWSDTTNGFVTNYIEFNEYGMPIKQTDPRGYATETEYDELKLYPLSQTNALGHAVTMSYDPATGNLIQSTDANGAVAKNTFDGLGRVIETEITDPKTTLLTTSKTVSYDDSSMPRSVILTAYNDDGAEIDSYTYLDGLGRTVETKQESADGKWVTNASIFDERGNVTKMLQVFFSNKSDYETVNESLSGTSFIYDALNRVTSVTNLLGVTYADYNIWDKTVTDANGNKKDLFSDARGRLIQVKEYLEGQAYSTAYDYDAAGNLIKITDALGSIRDFTYDSFGRRLSQTDAHKSGQKHGVWKYEYDENGNLTERIDPLNQTVTYVYDALNRGVNESSADGSGYSFIYDQGANAIGRLSSVTRQDYQHDFEYDLLGRAVRDRKKIDDKDFIFEYDYDLMGGVTRLGYPDGADVYYAYDQAHQLSTIYDDTRTFADEFDYTPLGQLSSIRLGNQIVTTDYYDPDKMYMLSRRQSSLAGVSGLQDITYTYDALGNLTKLIDSATAQTAKTVDYEYDGLYRLTKADYANTANNEPLTMSYGYDVIGNMTYKSDIGGMEYLGSNPHAVTKAGEEVFSYDEAGNMIQRNGADMVYDNLGRLTKSGDNTSYTYDEGGTRIKKTELATGNAKYYPNKYYEIDDEKEVKYVYAGKLKIAKIEIELQADSDQTDGEDDDDADTGDSDSGDSGSSDEETADGADINNPADVSAQASSGGVGGYRQPILAQTLTPATDNSSEEDAEADNADGISCGSGCLSQTGTKANTPKSLWPQVKTDKEIGFKNLRIVYKTGKAVISWGKMDKDAVKFDVYRSKEPEGKKLSKDATQKIAAIDAGIFRNRFSDSSIGRGEKYTYRIVALNNDGKILAASIRLTPELIFIKGSGGDVDFSRFTGKKFSRVHIYRNDHLDFSKTAKPEIIRIAPKAGFTGGARISVRYLYCAPKTNGGEYCVKSGDKELDVYVIQNPGAFLSAKNISSKFAGLLIPGAYADETEDEENVYYYLHDYLGGIEALVDEEGNVVERRDHLPYGSERTSIGESDESYGFTGKEIDDETGLYYYGARYYDPLTARFIQPDPLVLGESDKSFTSILANPQALNGYTYTLNNPTRYVDEEGEYGSDVHYDLTLYLSLAAGLDFGQSKTIAFFDQYTDENPETLPSNYNSANGLKQTAINVSNKTTEKYHFASRTESIGRLINALNLGDLSKFGTALHTFQDTYSHAGLNPVTHTTKWHEPDMTNLAPEKALTMAKNSFYILRFMNAKKNGIGSLTSGEYFEQTNKLWNSINTDIKDFLEMADKSSHHITKSAAIIKQDAVIRSSEDEESELKAK